MTARRGFSLVLFALFSTLNAPAGAQDDPLPSWNDGAAKTAIIRFVTAVTREDSPDYVPTVERIATFDNDGTLWSEKPLYFQFQFALDRLKTLAPQHPEWQDDPIFKAALEDDIPTVLKGGYPGLVKIVGVTHAGMTPEAFSEIVREWLSQAKEPRFDRPYTDLVYQPMLELLTYLRRNDFKTYIVSGGGVEFMRTFADRVYGVPPEQVIGTSIVTRFELIDGKPVLLREPEVFFIDDKAGKPVGINLHIGRRPLAAFGNSDGDYEMLRWTTAGNGPRFGLIVHHTDAQREWAYDRDSPVGRLDRALDEAPQNGWIVVDMKKDWKVIFPFEN